MITVILKPSIVKQRVNLKVGIIGGTMSVPQLSSGDIRAVKIENKCSLTKFDKSSRNSTENAIILGMNYLLLYGAGVII